MPATSALDGVVAAMRRVTSALPAGEEREGQVAMAEAVARAVLERRHLVVQAGTGTGKSLAYLVPCILLGVRCVVATATKALQDQLATKDLPFLASHLGTEFTFAVLKGRSNYLCRQRAREVGGDGQLAIDDEGVDTSAMRGQMMKLLAFGRDSTTGDRSELDFEPQPRAWAQVSVTAMECPGAARCPSGEECFAEEARLRAEVADVIVVNTHLYGTHLASGGFVLPEHDVVIFDEAHELEDVASSSLGLELGAGRFRALARNARGLVSDRAVVDDLDGAGTVIEAALEPWRGRRLPAGLGDQVAAAFTIAAERTNRVIAAARTSTGDDARKARVLQAGGHLAGDLGFAAAIPDSFVAWVEGPPQAPVFRMAPIDIGGLLAEKLWGARSAVLTSATIPAQLSTRLGIDPAECDQLDAGSPFDFGEQALLYCATHLPDPRRDTYEAAMHDELDKLIRVAGGRTLALFTSWRAMQAAAEELGRRLPFTLLTQSDLPKPLLLEAFATEETSCLFATMGFWQGVDIPGPSLSLVTLDRIPFPRPDEPLLQARRERAGPAAFRLIDLPRAATLLAQGAGRLIRNRTDRGVVAVLDPRLSTANYRWDLVRALPPMRRTRDLHEVEEFLSGLGSALE
jgi:ATP-dependent DNA helicase DinG